MLRSRTTRQIHKMTAVATVLLMAGLLASCTVKSNKAESGKENVKIETPVGGMTVNTNTAEAQDAGLALYPGATPKESNEKGHKSANVNISSSLFGVKVIAVEYISNDPPEKLISFYKQELAKYGEVIECKNVSNNNGELRCSEKAGSDEQKRELASGSAEREHLVSVKPRGKGSEFALVYVQTRGKEGTL